MKAIKDLVRMTANPGQASEVWKDLAPLLEPVLKPKTPPLQEAFFRVLGNSNFLARWTRRYPEKIKKILNTDWQREWTLQDYQNRIRKHLGRWENLSVSELAAKLTDFKYTNLFRITARDMGLGIPYPEIGREISNLCLSILTVTLAWHQRQLQEDLGEAKNDPRATHPIPFTIIGLGKLGGLELNFSSDVDLIYFYGTDDGKVFKTQNPTEYTPHQYFTKLAEKLTGFLNKKTAEGFLYRVDLELRPEGKSGTLVNSLEAMETYYETFGAFWEKQAFIRAAFVAGSHSLYNEFHRIMQPFIYPKIADYSFLEKLKDMKDRIKEVVQKSSDTGFHVKLGTGGIRELEFFVQSFQVLYGGKHPNLQTPNTLDALTQVLQTGLISPQDQQKLTQAYLYLRTLENRLQQAEEQQTHRLPQDPEELKKLARRMGYPNQDEDDAVNHLQEDLNAHCLMVKRAFENLVSQQP